MKKKLFFLDVHHLKALLKALFVKTKTAEF